MEAPRRYSVTPLPSYATVTTQHAPSFSETVRQIVAWLRGDRLTRRERQIEAAQIERLADLLADEEPETSPGPVRQDAIMRQDADETRSVDSSHGGPAD